MFCLLYQAGACPAQIKCHVVAMSYVLPFLIDCFYGTQAALATILLTHRTCCGTLARNFMKHPICPLNRKGEAQRLRRFTTNSGFPDWGSEGNGYVSCETSNDMPSRYSACKSRCQHFCHIEQSGQHANMKSDAGKRLYKDTMLPWLWKACQ